MGHEWYKDWFADERYLALYRHRNSAEAERALDLILKITAIPRNALILDLACGAGRHSIDLAKRGYTYVTGVDLSDTLIREAKLSAESNEVAEALREEVQSANPTKPVRVYREESSLAIEIGEFFPTPSATTPSRDEASNLWVRILLVIVDPENWTAGRTPLLGVLTVVRRGDANEQESAGAYACV